MCTSPQLLSDDLQDRFPKTRLPADPEGPAGNRYYVLLRCSVKRQPVGKAFQAASMLFNMSSVLSQPAIHAVASFQNAPEPMAAGIMSAPSKRKTSESFSRSGEVLDDRVAEVRGVEVLAGRQAGLAIGDDRCLVLTRVGVRQHVERLGLVGTGCDEVAAAEHVLRVAGLHREVEGVNVAVGADLGALGPDGGVEAGLLVHVAVAGQDREATLLELGRRCSLDWRCRRPCRPGS